MLYRYHWLLSLILLNVSIQTAFGSISLPFTLSADKIGIDPKDKTVLWALGNVKIIKKDIKIEADRIVIFQKESLVYAEGNIKVSQKDTFIQCERLIYNYKTTEGVFKNVKLQTQRKDISTTKEIPPPEGVTIKAKTVIKKSDHLEILSSSFSNCDMNTSHWKITSSSISFYPKKAIVGKNNIVYVGKIPVFYLPIFTKDLQHKYPWVKVELGHSRKWGNYILAKWKFHISQNNTLSLHTDRRQLRGNGFGVGLEDTRKNHFTKIFSYIVPEHTREKVEGPVVSRKKRWEYSVRHRSKFDHNYFLNIELDKIRDRYFRKDYFEEKEKTSRVPSARIVAGQTGEYTYWEIYIDKRINRFISQTEYLPEIRFSINEYPIENTGLYFSNISRIGKLRKNYDENLGVKGYNVSRIDIDNELSKPFTLFNILYTTPKIGIRDTFYSHTFDPEKEDIIRHVNYYELNVMSRGIKSYKYDSKILNIHSIRHIVEPFITFNHTFTPSLLSKQIYSFDDIDTIKGGKSIEYGINQLFQTKRGQQIWDLADIRIYQRYYPGNQSKRNLNEEYAFSNIFCDIYIYPNKDTKISSEVEYNRYKRGIDVFNLRTNTFFPEYKVHLNIEHRYLKASESQTTFNLGFKLSRNYSLDFYVKKDWNKSSYREISLGITRILHCWIMKFSYSYDKEERNNKIYLFLSPNF